MKKIHKYIWKRKRKSGLILPNYKLRYSQYTSMQVEHYQLEGLATKTSLLRMLSIESHQTMLYTSNILLNDQIV